LWLSPPLTGQAPPLAIKINNTLAVRAYLTGISFLTGKGT